MPNDVMGKSHIPQFYAKDEGIRRGSISVSLHTYIVIQDRRE